MGSEWREVALGDVCKIRRGSSPRPIVDFLSETEGMPWVKIADATESDSRFIEKTNQFIKEEGVCKSVIVEKGDLILSNSGTAGLPKFMSITACIHDGWQVLKELDGITSDYLYYTLLYIRLLLLHNAYDSTMKNLTLDMVREAKVDLPPLPEQKAIAHILGTLDDKIELNRRMNATLEGMAQALFKSWFVDFDPVIDNALAAGNPIPDELAPRAEVRRQALANGTTQQGSVNHPTLSDPQSLFPAAFEFNDEMGWIPEGWEIVNLGSVTTKFATGLNPRKNFVLGEGDNFYVTIKNMGTEGVILDERCDKVTDEALKKINARSDLKAGDMLFSGIGTIGRVHYIDQTPLDWNISESVFTLRGENSKISPNYLYRLLRGHDMQEYAHAMASGSVQKGIRMSALKEYLFVLPPREVMTLAEESLSVLLTKWKANISENNKLSKLRDTLLPKLISGELPISEAEQLTEEALT